MRAFAFLLCFVTTVGATIQAMSNLTADRLVGTWEAMSVTDFCASSAPILQMSFTAPDAAYFVATSYKDRLFSPQFLGKLTGSSLVDGHISLQFSATGNTTDYDYDGVEVEGVANRSGDIAYIEGTITLHRRDGKTLKKHVFFSNGLWVHDLAAISEAAQKILHDAQAQR